MEKQMANEMSTTRLISWQDLYIMGMDKNMQPTCAGAGPAAGLGFL